MRDSINLYLQSRTINRIRNIGETKIAASSTISNQVVNFSKKGKKMFDADFPNFVQKRIGLGNNKL